LNGVVAELEWKKPSQLEIFVSNMRRVHDNDKITNRKLMFLLARFMIHERSVLCREVFILYHKRKCSLVKMVNMINK
jgi:hypothetical protein